MGIRRTRSKCVASLRVGGEHAGRHRERPKCHAVFQVPRQQPPRQPPAGLPPTSAGPPSHKASAAADATRSDTCAPTAPRPTPQAILDAFEGTIRPVDLSAGYRLGVVLVMIVMVALPLVYLAIIALVGYGMFLYAVHSARTLSMIRDSWTPALAMVIYLGPLVVGGILVAFLVKPLFAPPGCRGRTRSLTPKSDPLLFAFVSRVCEALGAPEPRQINVDCQVNASAGFRRGLVSMFRDGDLVLTLGLPLVAGLSLREFAGVLAHEFGHFTQGTGLRLTYVIRTINYWFTRVVTQRDQWDIRLEAWARDGGLRIAPLLHLARFCIWLTRRILWVLMLVGHGVSGFLLRQMELDADRHEARLIGSKAFEPTSRKVLLLSVAYQGAQADLAEFYRDGRLGDNLPELVIKNLERIPAGFAREVYRRELETTAGWFDTHPATRDRIANARREDAPGVFHVECPATVLFSSFSQLSRNVTWDFYRAIFGPQFRPSDMHSTRDLLARQGREREAGTALGRFFQGGFHVLRPLPLPAMHTTAPSDVHETTVRLKAARQRIVEAGSTCAEACALFVRADTQTVEVNQAEAVLRGGLHVRDDEFSLPLASRAAAKEARAAAVALQHQVVGQLSNIEQAAGERLFAAIRLLHAPRVAERIEDAFDCRQEAAGLLAVLALLNRHHRSILELRAAHAVLIILLRRVEGHEQNESLILAIQKQMNSVAHRVRNLYMALSHKRYPFDHAKGEIWIADYALEQVPAIDDLAAICAAADSLLDRIPSLYTRVVARLAVIAEKVELALGLPPLPDPTVRN